MNDTTREVGGAVGIAVGGALLSTGYRNNIDGALTGLDGEPAELARDSLGGLLATTDADELIEAGQRAFTDGMQLAMFAATGLLLAAAALVVALYPRETVAASGSPTPTQEGVHP